MNEEEMSDGALIQIPEFVTENEEVRKNLRELDREIRNLQKTVEKEQKEGRHMEMHSYVQDDLQKYPQVTVVWYFSEGNSRLYDLMTLGADNHTGQPVTCREALEMTGMTGVDLSLQVGRLVLEDEEIRGDLQTTEMQGFRIGESGEVEEIYMKLTLKTEEEKGEEIEEHIEEHFFSYILREDRLVRLSEKGFDVP